MKLTLSTFTIGIIFFLGIQLTIIKDCNATENKGLSPDKRLNQYTLSVWNSQNGLPTKTLQELFISSDGYLWITSYNGIIRFDGIKFTHYNIARLGTIDTNTTYGMIETSDSTLWFVTQSDGIICYKNNQFSVFRPDLELGMMHMPLFIDRDSTLMAFSASKGWVFIDKDRNTEIIKWGENGLVYSEIRNVVQDAHGTIWAGTNGKGIYKYKDGRIEMAISGFGNDMVYSICPMENGVCIVGTDTGIFLLDGKNHTQILPQISCTVNKILKDSYGMIWIATIKGLYRWNPDNNNLEHFTSEDGLPDDFITDMLFDSENSLWMAHYKGGLSRLKDCKVINYTYKKGLPAKVVNSITETNNGHYLIAFDNGYLMDYDGKNFKEIRYSEEQKEHRIRHAFCDSKDNIWISTYSGLYEITAQGKVIKNNNDPNFPGIRMRFAFEDSQGRIWAGCRDSGLFRFEKNKTCTIFSSQNGLPTNLVLDIAEDSNGNFYICSSGGDTGLSLINSNDSIINFNEKDGFTSNIAFCTYIGKDNCVWIATNNGLFRYKDSEFKHIDITDGLPSNSLYNIQEDQYGFFWIPSNMGILKAHKSELNDYMDKKRDDFRFTIIDRKDGMAEEECNATSESLLSSSGLLFFPMVDGFVSIDPRNETKNKHIPNVVIERLLASEKTYSPHEKIVLPPSTERIMIEYTATALSEPERVVFKYKLEGFDKDWITVQNVRNISYTNLPHKAYTFRVLACNSDGLWNEVGDSINFTIKRRFVETWYFFTLVFLIVGGCIGIFYYIRIRSLQRRKKELEKIVEKRTISLREKNESLQQYSQKIQEQKLELESSFAEIEKQSQELKQQREELESLNEFKNQIFRIIACDLRTPLISMNTLLESITMQWFNNFPKEKLLSWMIQLNALSHSTFALLDNLLNWSLNSQDMKLFNPQKIELNTVVTDVIHFMSPLSKEKKITIQKDVPENTFVYADDNMLRSILRNFTNNAIKYSLEKGQIEISAQVFGDEIEISVTDKGIGMSAASVRDVLNMTNYNEAEGLSVKKSSGLSVIISMDFIRKHGSELHIDSKEGEGSRFYFRLKSV